VALRRIAPLCAALAGYLLVWLTSATLRSPAGLAEPARASIGMAVASGKVILHSVPDF
jgi:hypothetical protein